MCKMFINSFYMAVDSISMQKKVLQRNREKQRKLSSMFRKKKRNVFFAYADIGFAVVWMLLIFILSSQSGFAQQGTSSGWILFERKGAHVVEFFVLTVALYRVIRHAGSHGMYSARLGAVAALFYAFTDEVHQLFVPFREGKLSDVAVDGLGISIAYLVLMIYVHFSCQKQKPPCISPKKRKK